MEEQLAAYRARKAREQAELNAGNTWFGSRSSSHQAREKKDMSDKSEDVEDSREQSPQVLTQNSSGYLPTFITNSRLGNAIRQDNSILTNTLFLKFILWFSLLVFFVLIEFAAVFVVLSIFYVMYANMRGSGDTRKPGEPSAYSVFNPNCERIDGTLTAEQFEKELRYGPGGAAM